MLFQIHTRSRAGRWVVLVKCRGLFAVERGLLLKVSVTTMKSMECVLFNPIHAQGERHSAMLFVLQMKVNSPKPACIPSIYNSLWIDFKATLKQFRPQTARFSKLRVCTIKCQMNPHKLGIYTHQLDIGINSWPVKHMTELWVLLWICDNFAN